jgi:TonB-linked SusC/RagA family outer membrane protein
VLQGKVVNEDNQPMLGVTVSLNGTSRVMATDVEGRFIVEITSEDDSLSFSFVGYQKKTVVVGTAKTLTVKMDPDVNNQLNDVTVVGYGTQKKISVTGSIATISTKEIAKTATPSLSNAIAGKLPGIITRQALGEPGYDAAQVFIRGMSTWVNAQPLILIDGIQREMNNINAQEIESFTILKDASATAVYGVRGANGVILITTKRGKLAKPQVQLRSETAVLTTLRMPDYINSWEYASLWNEARASRNLDPRWTDEEIRKFKDGSDPYLYPNTDWAEVVMKDHTMQTINNLSVTGGSNFIRYFANVGYTIQDGVYREDLGSEYPTNAQIKRYNFRSNIDVDVSPTLKMYLGLGGIIQSGNYPGGGSSYDIFHAMRFVPGYAFAPLNPDGTVSATTGYPGIGLHQNPFAMVARAGYTRQDRSTLQGTFSTKWDLSKLITKGLAVSGRFAYDRYNQNDNYRGKPYLVKQYLGKDANGVDQYLVVRQEQPMGYGIGGSANRAIYTELQVSYDRSFGDHAISSMVLYNDRDYVDLTAGSSILNLPYRQQGFAGRVTYNYDNRYLAEFNAGYNGSENFPEGKRFGFFPSVSVGWNISQEKFFDVGFINNLKLRASRGRVGNDQIGGTRFLFLTKINPAGQSYRFGIGNVNTLQGAQESLTGNPDVTWEVATKNNVGIDLDLFNNRISLQVDVFNETREGILIQRQTVPEVVGILPSALPYGNRGKTKNRGIDGMIEMKHTTRGNVFYSLRANYTFARNTIIENDEPLQRYAYQSGKNMPIGQQLVLIADGLYQSEKEIMEGPKSRYMTDIRVGDIKYRDINGDGYIDDYDKVRMGFPRVPQVTFGFGGTVSYKGFDLSLYFTGASRTSIFMDGWAMMPFWDGAGNNNVLRDYYDNRWTPETPNAKYPRIDNGKNTHNYIRSTQYMTDGTYLRLRNAELGYNFPKHMVNRIGLNNLRLFVNGINLYTWDKVKIIDPESDDGTGNYPLQRSANFGVQIDFK